MEFWVKSNNLNNKLKIINHKLQLKKEGCTKV